MNRTETAALAVPPCGVSPDENEERPGTPRRHPRWSDVPVEQWDDWRWQMQNASRTTSQLAEFFAFSPDEFSVLEELERK